MSLTINTNKVTSVLLSDGKWYNVATKSFNLGDCSWMINTAGVKGLSAYNFTGRSWGCAVTDAGFQFTDSDSGKVVYGPMSAVHAVKL